MAGRAAIYHFTNGSEKRPAVNKKELDRLADFARQKGYTDIEIFCDTSLRKEDQHEFRRLMDESVRFSTIIAKDFYHLSKNTMRCFEILKWFSDRGIEVLTMQDGDFRFTEPPLTDDLTIATYTCRFEARKTEEVINLQNDIFRDFAEKKTSWTVEKQYADISKNQRDEDQLQLQELIQDSSRYDLLLVRNLNDVHWRTANFCKVRNALKLDIYSIKEGFLPFRKEKAA
ncbi:MAG: recombinase family protein [Lachnospiraceae bacterium]|nr:recombinase family protein [Lachnospiraceae bacterium]